MRRSNAPSNSAKRPRTAYKKSSRASNRATITTLGRIPRQVNTGFQKQCTQTHEYSGVFVLTSSAGMQKYQYNCLGMFDPDQTGGGHQPSYYDTMTTIYNHYVVTKSKIIVRCSPQTAATPTTIVAMFTNDDTATIPTNVPAVVEQSSGTSAHWLPQGASQETVLYGSYDAVKTYGGNVISNNSLQGTVSSNPTEGLFWTICQETNDGLSNASVVYIVEITYQVIWSELKDIAQS